LFFIYALLAVIYAMVLGAVFVSVVWYLDDVSSGSTSVPQYFLAFVLALLWPLSLPAFLGGNLVLKYIEEYVNVAPEKQSEQQ
jgi:hypothetical protein